MTSTSTLYRLGMFGSDAAAKSTLISSCRPVGSDIQFFGFRGRLWVFLTLVADLSALIVWYRL